MREKRRRIVTALAILAGLLAVTLVAATGPLRVTYYYLPG